MLHNAPSDTKGGRIHCFREELSLSLPFTSQFHDLSTQFVTYAKGSFVD